MKKLLLFAVVIIGFSASAFAQPLTATATANANIVAAISITHTGTDMSFGNIILAGVPGIVDLKPDGTRSSALSLPGGTVSAAQFQIGGVAGTSYKLILPVSVLVKNAGGTTMTVDAFIHNASLKLVAATEDFAVGAKLHAVGTEPTGPYKSDPFDVTVAYE